MENIRSLTLNIPVENHDQATAWLGKQSDNIRRTTFVTEAGKLAQKAWIDPEAYVDPTAQLMGGMIINKGCYVGPNAVVRLDEKPDPEPLVLGINSNIQDCAVVHSTTQHIGSSVIVAHQSIVHGAVVEDDVTIYIQAVVDGNGTVIGKGSFLHQGAYVGKGIVLPAGSYVEPGQKILTQAQAESLGPVPDALKAVRDHVLELNALHTQRYLTGG